MPVTNCIPLTRCTIRSPATPVPDSCQQRQRAKISGLKDFLGTSFCQVSQSKFAGDKSAGGGYSHAPSGLLRPNCSSTCIKSPIAPLATNSVLCRRPPNSRAANPPARTFHHCSQPRASSPRRSTPILPNASLFFLTRRGACASSLGVDGDLVGYAVFVSGKHAAQAIGDMQMPLAAA